MLTAAEATQASTVPGEGNAQQALYWQVSDDQGDTWTPPRPALPPYLSPTGQRLPYWSPVLHMQASQAASVPLPSCSLPTVSPPTTPIFVRAL